MLKKQSIILFLVGLLSSACASTEGPPVVTQTDQVEKTPAPTAAEPTATRTPTPLPATATPALEILVTPSFEETLIAEDFLFAPSIDPDCQLPCWQGLRVGTSQAQDVQAVADEVFKLEGSVDLFSPSYLQSAQLPVWEELPGYSFTGYDWYFEPGILSIVFWLDDSTQVLSGIRMWWSAPGGRMHSPQEIIKSLGLPSAVIVADIRETIATTPYDSAGTRMFIVYGELGIVVFYEALTFPVKSDAGGAPYGELCLTTGEGAPVEMVYILLPPVNRELNELTPLNEYLIGHWKETRRGLVSIEVAFDITLEELTARVMSEQSTCIRTRN